LQWQTLGILGMGLVAFALDTVAGLAFGKAMSIITKGKINPLIGACGISAFPMSARVISRIALDENPNNFLIMHAMASNTAGQIGSVMAGGAIMALLAH
jgi:oxaloacetate decarboxylase beta subunit